MFHMVEWTKIPVQVCPILINIPDRDWVLLFSPGEILETICKSADNNNNNVENSVL